MSKKTLRHTSEAEKAMHPGSFVRKSVLAPRNLTVQGAAKLVGVGRPALSNFLNGKAATTPEMASRLEVAFGVSASDLLDRQAAYDAARARAVAPPNAVPYTVPFLNIKANEIELWAERNIRVRTQLAVLLRTLVNSAGIAHTVVDFPGNDDAERPGWDGYLESPKASPWIPGGISGWEFGASRDATTKADGDFAKSVRATTKAQRENMTFVFVTPRHWPGKAAWLKKAREKAQWKDVRAYDSSDLEQWLEQSLPAQVWFASETNRLASNVRSLDKCWGDWANVTSPPLVGSLFAPAIEAAGRVILSRLQKAPDGPIVIVADSGEEACAFLSQLFGPTGGSELAPFRDRVLVLDAPGVLPKLAQGTTDFLVVTSNRDVERELGPFSREIHSIAVYPRNAANVTPDVVLEPLSAQAFTKALEEMQLGRDDIDRYSNESGRSLTVLRRRLTNFSAIKNPPWADDRSTARGLIPFLFIGAWEASNTADQTILSWLADDVSYEVLEKQCQDLAVLEDAPLWSVDRYRGVVSKIDLLFAIASAITSAELQRYFDMAKLVLEEDDPTLDLPEDDRWAAGIYGKKRDISTTAREGIAETLVLLAVYGNQLVLDRTGFNCELAAAELIEDLLTPLTARTLEAQDRDLTAYAEAAPSRFLSILEEDLRSHRPESYGLLRPAGTALFGSCPRSGLLWALEGLAWDPETLPRVTLVLAQLAEIEINDNWGNKPINSLESIFRAWMPQTTADIPTRVSAVQLAAERFPKTAWRICMSQLDASNRTGTYNHKPVWRNDAYGHGEPVKTLGPVYEFKRHMLDMVLDWKSDYTLEMICDLIQQLPSFHEDYQARTWDLVHNWAETHATDLDKAVVREKIRVTILTRRAARRSGKKITKVAAAAEKARQALESADMLNRHEWLFRQPWVELSMDEMDEEDYADYRKRDELVAARRGEALREIIEARGVQGVIALAEMGKTAAQIGWVLISHGIIEEHDVPALVNTVLPQNLTDPSWARKELVNGLLRSLKVEARMRALATIAEGLQDADLVRVLLLAPFERNTWHLVATLDEVAQQQYWENVHPVGFPVDAEELNEAVELLLRAHRPRTAFALARFDLKDMRPELLFRVMSELLTQDKDPPDHYRLEQHDIESAFTFLDKHATFTLEQMAMLELAYIEALSRPWSEREGYGLPNLGKYVEAHPEMFIQAIVWMYRRNDGEVDPPEWIVTPEHAKQYAERAYKLLEGLEWIPGHNDLGELEPKRLADWIKIVRDACQKLGRLEVAEISIGKLLSEAPHGADGVWPCEPVRQVMEELRSREVMRGAHTGLYNSRGATWRGEGGDQERELAGTYRAWANALQYSHPFVSSELLVGMARTYEEEARREDTRAKVGRRLRK